MQGKSTIACMLWHGGCHQSGLFCASSQDHSWHGPDDEAVIVATGCVSSETNLFMHFELHMHCNPKVQELVCYASMLQGCIF